MKTVKVEVKTITQVTQRLVITVDVFRRWLGIPVNFEITDVKIPDDTGSKYNQVWIETREMTAKEFDNRRCCQREEEDCINVDGDE